MSNNGAIAAEKYSSLVKLKAPKICGLLKKRDGTDSPGTGDADGGGGKPVELENPKPHSSPPEASLEARVLQVHQQLIDSRNVSRKMVGQM